MRHKSLKTHDRTKPHIARFYLAIVRLCCLLFPPVKSLYWLDQDDGEEPEGFSSPPLLEVLKGPVGGVRTLPELVEISESPSIERNARQTPRGSLNGPPGAAPAAWAWAPDLKPGETVRSGILSRFSALPSASDPPGITRTAFRRMAAPVFALVREARDLYRRGRHKQARNRMMAAEQHTAAILGEDELSQAELKAAVTSAQNRMYRVAGDVEEALERVLRNAWLYDWTNPERCIRRLRLLHFPDKLNMPDQLTPIERDLLRAGNPLMIILTYPVIAGTIRAQMDGKIGQSTTNAKWGQNPLPCP